MPDITPRPDRELSTEETTWLKDFLSYEASALIKADPEAGAAAKDLVSALGGSPPAENITGWLDSETEVLDEAVLHVVKEAEQTVLAQDDLEPVKSESELDSEEELDDESEEEIDEELAYFAQLEDTELDKLIALYDKLLELVDRVGNDADLSDADMETLTAAAEAGIITLSFDEDEADFEVVAEGELTLESLIVD